MFAANAILAALYARERTGEGQRIDMALLDSQIALLTYAASNYFVSGEIPTRHGTLIQMLRLTSRLAQEIRHSHSLLEMICSGRSSATRLIDLTG